MDAQWVAAPVAAFDPLFNRFSLIDPFLPWVTQFGVEFQEVTRIDCPLEVRVIVNAFLSPGLRLPNPATRTPTGRRRFARRRSQEGKGPQGSPAAHSVPLGYSSGRKGQQGIALLRRIRCLLGSSGRKGQQDIYSPAAPQLVPSGFTGIYEILRIVYETWGVAFPNALNGEAFL